MARHLPLVVVCAATALLLLDVTVVNVALPAIREDLDASFAELQWVVDAYALVLAALLLVAGTLADRAGRRRILVLGLVAFTAASVACGLAPSGLALDVARALQGAGAAAMFSASLALLAHEHRGPDRARALAVWGAVTGAALAVGPLVGGVLVDALGWRWAFLVNLPAGALLAWLAATRLPESRDPVARRLDLPGAALFGTGAAALTYGLVRGNPAGWDAPEVVGALAAAAVLVVAFVVHERRTAEPLLDLRLFADPRFSGTALVAFAQSVALYPLFLFLAVYLQEVLGHSPTGTGLRLLPLTLVLLAVAPLSGRLSGRVALRVPLVAGLVLIALGLVLLHGVDPQEGWTNLLPGLVVGGLAIGTISPALAAAMVSVLPVERSGLAAGVANTFRQLGIAVGIAGLGAVFTSHGDDVVAGLDAVFLVAAAVAALAAVVAWPLLGDLRSDDGRVAA
jgi:EmrB/QacA subfamily drug resistance transporter